MTGQSTEVVDDAPLGFDEAAESDGPEVDVEEWLVVEVSPMSLESVVYHVSWSDRGAVTLMGDT